MHTRRASQLITVYVLALTATLGLLVVWVAYVVRTAGEGGDWRFLAVGSLLLAFLVLALTYQLAEALAARRYALKQEEFLSHVTHEMKSPLAAIKLHAQTLAQQEEPEPEVRRRFLATIEQQADRMAALVDAVLESSRLQAGRRQLDLVPVDLGTFCAGYLEEARRQVEGRGVALVAEIAEGARGLASEEALRQVMDNLIENAVRFSARGGEVRVRVAVRGETVGIEVEDDGVGIPKSELSKIFDRFYQLGREGAPLRKGAGLGLSIVSGLVREMRGTVRAFSQEERPGARLLVELPLAGGRP
ncbi:MAG TPA: HAMP domain-containing sensor histidine kinase [Thermoanaerobaculia bacterium]|nr:HAMP domain-containing sensor histidine kinase [Thermoanaerobaculia bacterium]